MCGIAGYYGAGNKEILKKMTDSLYHRGPDDEGFFVDEHVGLGHRRLSIIDLSPAGHQPMSNEDGSLVIAFNGEAYNFKELKKSLKRRHEFKGDSDTEVILHLYEEQGTGVFSKLNGMFALAIYDKNKKNLILARDKMGKKPLYWSRSGRTLIFGSELKALMAHSGFEKKLDLESLNKYLFYEYIPSPRTIFSRVYKLEPGYFLEYNGQEIKKTKFWDISFNRITEINFKDKIKEFDGIMEKAVNDRLVSDVPLGVFLSGGIDSSTVAYYAQKNSAQKIKTFSIGFKEKSFDESAYARRASAFLGTEHYEKIFSARDCLELIPKIAEILDEPMADPSIVPTFLLSKFAREKVTVALGGDGGDELLCGYDTFVAHRLAEIYERIPSALRKYIIEKIALGLPASFSNISFDFKAKSFISGFYGEKKYRDHRWMSSFAKEKRSCLFNNDCWQELTGNNEYEDIDNYLSNVPGWDNTSEKYFQSLIYLYLRMYLAEDILVKVDRASMFNSLEVRAPFLDTAVVDFANSLPINFKLRGLTTKYLLKKTMAGKLPKDIINRKKKGFGMPIAEWISNDLRSFALEILSEQKIKREGLFNFDFINGLLNSHFSGKQDNRKPIWTLLVFEMWMDKWYN